MGTLHSLKRRIKNLLSRLGVTKSNAVDGSSSGYVNLSFSQEGEDLILNRIFGEQPFGFFLDIGAHHPRRFSNTYIFYLKGWTGINIDPLPGTKALFDKERPRDINLEMGVGEKEDELIYYSFNEPALNTFDKLEAEKKSIIPSYFIKEEIRIKTFPLSMILENHLKDGQIIDFMTIDVEGLDLEVLKSNNWAKFKPRLILVEELRTNIEKIMRDSDIYNFLAKHGYLLYFRTYNTSFYMFK